MNIDISYKELAAYLWEDNYKDISGPEAEIIIEKFLSRVSSKNKLTCICGNDSCACQSQMKVKN